MSNSPSYEERLRDFDWSQAEKELGYRAGEPINIGWHCTDRICELGLGAKKALIWEDHRGESRTYTFDDLRVLTNTLATHLQGLGLQPGERVCLFMDRVPELYLGFLAVLKMGGIVQPLFSAFGDESLLTRLDNARTAAIITQRKHAPKVRKILDRLPGLRHVIVVDQGDAPLKDRETALELEKLPRVDKFDVFPSRAETPSVLHYTSGTTGQPKGAQHVHYSLISQYLTAKWVLDLRPDDIYWCNADPGWVTGTSYGIIGPWANGVTQVVLDAGFNTDKWYAFIQKHRITVWYSAPTAIRLLMREGTPAAAQVRPLLAAASGQRRRAAQRRGRGVGPGGVRPAVPRHLLADRDRLHGHHQFPGHEGQAGLDGAAVPRHHRHGARSRDARAVSRAGARRADRAASRAGRRRSAATGRTRRATSRSSATAGTSAATAPASTRTATSGSSGATTT